MELLIRPIGGPAEIEACARMMSSTEPWITLGRSFEESLQILEAPDREVSVALLGTDLVGFVILNMKGPFAGYIQTICVSADHRSRGIGTRIIAWAEERIFKESPNVFLCVSSFNPEARRLYERLGYRAVGELENFIVTGHSEILLRKTRGDWTTFRRRSTRSR